jgi:hypothetical protein
MKRTLISATGIALLLTLATPAAAQDLASQVVGVWKFTGVSQKEVATGKITHPFGKKPTGYNIWTKGGHLAWVLVADNRKGPAGTSVTDAERINLFNTMAAATGTYKVEGNAVLTTYETSSGQTLTGTTQKRQIEIEGNKLTITWAPSKNAAGQEVIYVSTFERVE